jgi:uncharacterized protein YhbP (UPF0306 family)
MSSPPVDIRSEALTLLAQCRTASLATVDAHGRPHAANIQYAFNDQLNLYFVSSPNAAHSRHIAQNPAVALTVYHPLDAEPQTLHGLQLHARATPVTDAIERANALAFYTARFPFITTDPQLAAAVEQQSFYKLTPTWLRLIDNRRGFGWKAEMQLT